LIHERHNQAMKIFRNMHLFVEVARASSFRRAAGGVGPARTPPCRAASPNVERAVGLRLFNRSTRRVELTEGGRLYFNNCQRIIQEVELAASGAHPPAGAAHRGDPGLAAGGLQL
jgi:DNA-binding transcriptional LysR family regulator